MTLRPLVFVRIENMKEKTKKSNRDVKSVCVKLQSIHAIFFTIAMMASFGLYTTNE